MIFRYLKDDFFNQLNNKDHVLHFILEFERKHRKSFIVEIRKNFLDLYFLGHGIEVKQRKNGYLLIASKEFDPTDLLEETPKHIVKPYGEKQWQISFNEISNYDCFEEIMNAVLAQIVRHRNGDISEGVSEVNHFIDNRSIEKNGILIIDRQVAYPRSKKGKIDLLGLKRLPSGLFTFVVIELKNKNNKDIKDVFTRQLKRYIDLVYDKYDDFRDTYEKIFEQKVDLALLKRTYCKIAPKNEISLKDIEGIVILDNLNIRSDLKGCGLLGSALRNWAKIGKGYTSKLFLKTNVLDSTFFLNLDEANICLEKYKKLNL